MTPPLPCSPPSPQCGGGGHAHSTLHVCPLGTHTCRSLDDATYATLSSLALFNNVEVVGALAGDPDFLRSLFLALEGASPGDGEWADLVAFLQVGLGSILQAAMGWWLGR